MFDNLRMLAYAGGLRGRNYALYRVVWHSLFICLFWSYIVLAKQPTTEDILYRDDLGLTKVIGQPMAFADFNSDKHTDVLILSGDQKTLWIYLWNKIEDRFIKSNTSITLTEEDTMVIENVVPGDFNYDGTLDILIMGRTVPKADDADGELQLRVYLGDGKDGLVSPFIQLPSSTAVQPIPFDFAGDMRVHLLGYPSDQPDRLSVWRNKAPALGENQTALFDVIPMPKSEQFCRISHPHSNAFIDLDGDCLADLFLTCQETPDGPLTYQIWINKKNEGFKLARTGRLPDGAGAVSFADIDGNGSMDMVVPACKDEKCSIYILYNHQAPLCGASYSRVENCRPINDLCRADPDFYFGDPTNATATEGYTRLDINDLIDNARLVLYDKGFLGTLPIPVRTGDLNQDGYPDLLLTVEKDTQRLARILTSQPCTPTVCTEAQLKAGRRSFTLLKKGTNALYSLQQVSSTAFFDFEEDGTLDMLVMAQPAKQTEHQADRTLVPIQNNYFNDAFFLKTLVLNGVCPGRCPMDEGYARLRPYGVSYHGASFRYSVIDRQGRKHAKAAAQLSQAAYVPLQMPYCLFGLGRTNNYVEELFVGVTRHQLQHYRDWAGVIPNAQLIVVPYQDADAHDPDSWTRELFVNPSDYVPGVLATLIGASIVLAAIVMLLDWREKREDRREKRSISHVLNFDAL